MPLSTLLASRLANLQLFQEVTWGTSAATTARLMGVTPYPSFKPKLKTTIFDEDRASFAPGFNSANLEGGGEFNWNMYGTFEDIRYILRGGLLSTTPVGGSTVAIVSSTNASPIVITATAHGLATGDDVFISGHLVNTAANGAWTIIVLSANTFSLTGSTGNGVGVATGTVGIQPFTETYTAPAGSAWNAQSYSIEYSYDIGTLQAKGCLINKWGIKGEAKKQWDVSVAGFYKTHIQNGTLTAAIPNRAVNVILFPSTALYIDVANAAPGTTPITGALAGFGLEVTNGLSPVYTGDSVDPSNWTYDTVKPSLSLKLLYTASVKAALAPILAGNRGVIRLKQTTSAKSHTIDFAGVIADDPSLYGNEQGGAKSIEIKLDGQNDDGTLAGYLKLINVCSKAVLI